MSPRLFTKNTAHEGQHIRDTVCCAGSGAAKLKTKCALQKTHWTARTKGRTKVVACCNRHLSVRRENQRVDPAVGLHKIVAHTFPAS